MMAAKKRFIAELEKHNATFEDDDFDFVVDAPRGFVWECDSVHYMRQAHCNGRHSFKPHAYSVLIERMESGVVECDEVDCEICNEAENE